jgi:hypothetical protein
MEYFFIEKQKVVLFLKYRKNGWESAASALRQWGSVWYDYKFKGQICKFPLK